MVSRGSSSWRQEDIKVSSSPSELSVRDGEVSGCCFREVDPTKK